MKGKIKNKAEKFKNNIQIHKFKQNIQNEIRLKNYRQKIMVEKSNTTK